MGELELVQALSQWGPLGILTGGMFVLYRRDTNQHIENWRGQSEKLADIIEGNTAAIVALTLKLDQVIEIARRKDG